MALSPMRVAEAAASAANFVSCAAGDDEHRHGEAVESVPQRVLGARAGLAERLGQALDGVLGPLAPGTGRRRRGRRRAAGPARRRRSASTPVALEPLRHGLVLGGAGGARLRVVDAAGGADEHEPADELRQRERQVEHEAPAHRVAEVGGLAALVGDEAGTGAEAGVERRAAAVPRRVDAAHLVVGDEVVEHRTPAVAVLGEAVDQHESRAPPRHLGVQHGRRGRQRLPDPPNVRAFPT